MFCALAWARPAAAQRGAADSAGRARAAALAQSRAEGQRRTDSTRTARQSAVEELRAGRQASADSLRLVRKHSTDSFAAIRKYRESRRYKDSVTKSRSRKLKDNQTAMKARTDSMRSVRKSSMDSAIAARQALMAPVRAAQKKRTDSFAAIRRYKESKRFRDSTTVVTRLRKDSITRSRADAKEALMARRKSNLEDLKAARKVASDSVAAIRKVRTDSIAAVRKAKAAELAKKKKDRENVAVAKDKQKKKQFELALELKIKQKRQKITNERMLKKRWAFPRRPIQNTFTHYNYYFNASRKMDEAELNMQRVGKDDFDTLIALSLYDPSRDSSLLSADMDSIIQKASIGIQLHDPRTKWADDLYLLLGEAFYYKGRYDDAEAAFKYVVSLRDKLKTPKEVAKEKAEAKKEKTSRGIVEKEKEGLLARLKHQSVHNEALLWLSRTYSASGKYSDAEAVLDILSADNNLPDDLRGRVALEKAVLALARDDRKEAADNLFIASADKSIPDFTRRRAAYLGGQLLQEGGRYNDAATSFDRVSDLHPKVEMEFYARKARAYNLMMAGGASDDAIASLKRMLGDNKFAQYNEQVYYLLGQLSANKGETKDAEKYLRQSVTSVKNTRRQKALSFAALGHLYFNGGQYESAKVAYDSAAHFASAALGDEAVALAVQRSRILDKVSVPTRAIRTGDSLLALADLPEKERRAAVRKHLRAMQAASATDSGGGDEAGIEAVARMEGSGGSGGLTWYFANATLMQQGNNDFKRKWGTRPNSDNWRRSAALMSAGGAAAGSGAAAEDNDLAAGNGEISTGNTITGVPTEESLLAQIPIDASRRDATRLTIQRAHVDLANAYFAQFEDYQRARTTLDTLSRRYPEHPDVAEALYLNYLIALRQNDPTRAESIRAGLLSKYNGSSWAAKVQPVDEKAAPGTTVAELYDVAYAALQERRYGEALSAGRSAMNRPGAGPYTQRIRLVQASALAGSQNFNEADTLVRSVLASSPETAVRNWAESIQAYILAYRPAPSAIDTAAGGDDTPVPAGAATPLPGGAVEPPRLSGTDSAGAVPGGAAAPLPLPAEFTYKPAEKHAFLFIYKVTDSRTLGLRAALSDFNTFKYPGQALTTRVAPLSPTSGLVITESFQNIAGAKAYMRGFIGTPLLVREFIPADYTLVIISDSNLRKLEADRNTVAYLAFYRKFYK